MAGVTIYQAPSCEQQCCINAFSTPLGPLTWPSGMGWGPRHGLAAQDHSPGGLPLTGALHSNPPCMSKRVAIHLPEYPACVSSQSGNWAPRTRCGPCPLGAPVSRVGQRRPSRPCGQLISVLISPALGRGSAQDGPPGSPGLRVLWAAPSGLSVCRPRGSCHAASCLLLSLPGPCPSAARKSPGHS